MLHSTKQSVLFPELISKPTTVVFDQPEVTSDGGALLLKAVDDQIGLTQNLAAVLADPREPGKIRHSLGDMLRQRIFGICCGYGDTNDAARLNTDPMHKLLLDRDPVQGDDLASQPTLSRFENQRRKVDLLRMGTALADTVIAAHRSRLRGRKCKLITLDLDATDDPCHGSQQLSLFNGHYDRWCYLPLLAFVSFDDEKDQHLLAAMLRPGTAHCKVGAVPLLKRLIPAVKKAFPTATIRVRLDGGFCCPEILDYLDAAEVQYLVGMAKNRVLQARAKKDIALARECFSIAEKTYAVYGQQMYAAGSWKTERRVIHKAETVTLPGREPLDNLRFVVTNIHLSPKEIYDIYRQRGDSENRIKELKDELDLGRLSCHGFWANQLRLLLSAAAFVIMQMLRTHLTRLGMATCQTGTLRLRLLKIGGRITRSVRRYVVHLAVAHPWAAEWQRAARKWGAVSM
jgi:hypothetical protein